MSDKRRCHELLDGFGPFGTLQIIGTGKDFEVCERKITKQRDLPDEHKKLLEAVVRAFKCTTIKIIAVPTGSGSLRPDRVEMLFVR